MPNDQDAPKVADTPEQATLHDKFVNAIDSSKADQQRTAARWVGCPRSASCSLDSGHVGTCVARNGVRL